MTLTTQLHEFVSAGAKYFALEFGILSHIQGNDYRVVVQTSPDDVLQDGQVFPLSTTCCSVVLRRDDVLAQSRMTYSNYMGHPCYTLFKVQTYIGLPIRVGGRVFGTLNFSSPIPYHRQFAEEDIRYLRKLAESIEALLQDSSQATGVKKAKVSIGAAVSQVFSGKRLSMA